MTTSPYTHPSMPGTRYLADSIPGHLTDSPARTPEWERKQQHLVLEDALLDTEGQHLVQNILTRKAQESA